VSASRTPTVMGVVRDLDSLRIGMEFFLKEIPAGSTPS
jgi:hypothetical protein